MQKQARRKNQPSPPDHARAFLTTLQRRPGQLSRWIRIKTVGPHHGSSVINSEENELRANGVGLCPLLAAWKLFTMALGIRGTTQSGEWTRSWDFHAQVFPLFGEAPPIFWGLLFLLGWMCFVFIFTFPKFNNLCRGEKMNSLGEAKGGAKSPIIPKLFPYSPTKPLILRFHQLKEAPARTSSRWPVAP